MRTRRGFLRLLAGLPLLAVLPWRKAKPPKVRPSSVKVKYCPAYDLGEINFAEEYACSPDCVWPGFHGCGSTPSRRPD